MVCVCVCLSPTYAKVCALTDFPLGKRYVFNKKTVIRERKQKKKEESDLSFLF